MDDSAAMGDSGSGSASTEGRLDETLDEFDIDTIPSCASSSSSSSSYTKKMSTSSSIGSRAASSNSETHSPRISLSTKDILQLIQPPPYPRNGLGLELDMNTLRNSCDASHADRPVSPPICCEFPGVIDPAEGCRDGEDMGIGELSQDCDKIGVEGAKGGAHARLNGRKSMDAALSRLLGSEVGRQVRQLSKYIHTYNMYQHGVRASYTVRAG